MNLLILCTALLILETKVLDCATTLRAIHTAPAETNPIARRIMELLGVRRAVALIFVLSATGTCTLAAVVLMTEDVLWKAFFVGAGLFVATVQGAVAHTNWTGRWNAVTATVLRCHRVMAKIARRRWPGQSDEVSDQAVGVTPQCLPICRAGCPVLPAGLEPRPFPARGPRDRRPAGLPRR